MVANPARNLLGRIVTVCRSRRDIEKDYYQDWERTTLLAQEERDRPMTLFTFLAFLPAWLKFYALPGPLRFAAHLLWRYVLAALHQVHKRLVIQGEEDGTKNGGFSISSRRWVMPATQSCCWLLCRKQAGHSAHEEGRRYPCHAVP